MKITKVNNVREAVVNKGLIYQASVNASQNLEKHVAKRVNAAAGMYNVFFSKENNSTIKYWNGQFKDIVKSLKRKESSEEIKSLLYRLDFGKTNKEKVSNLVSETLRKGLRKVKNGKNSEHIITNIILGNVRSVPDEDIEFLLSVFKEDILKEKLQKKIVKSIENQNVKVKTNEQGMLVPSNSDNKKKYVFEFMKKYSSSEKTERENMLKHIRVLILEFFGVVVDEADVGAWTFGQSLNDTTTISETISNLFQEMYQTKSSKSKLNNIKNEINSLLVRNYTNAVVGKNDSDKFWLSWIQDEAENILLTKPNESKLNVSFLCHRIFDNFTAYIAGVYVNLGKGVYHFVLPENMQAENLEIKEVQPKYKENGISSFDYESIKAEESMSRDFSVYVTFAARNFSSAVCDYEKIEKAMAEGAKNIEDPLQYNNNIFAKYKQPENTLKLCLQYFGGVNKWNLDADEYSDWDVFEEFKDAINLVRNSSFHYSASNIKLNKEGLINILFEGEKSHYSALIRKKYYSNNVMRFYTEDNIKKMFDLMYSKNNVRAAQIPSFNKIINRNKMYSVLLELADKGIIDRKHLDAVTNNKENRQMYYSAMMFVLKEIYYYGFLSYIKSKDLFLAAAKRGLSGKDVQNTDAAEDFYSKVMTFKNNTFGEICQALLTEYELQNQGNKRVKDAKNKENVNFKHYKLLLYKYMYNAFIEYLAELTKNKSLSLVNPSVITKISSEEDFCKDYHVKMYDSLLPDNDFTKAWYVAAHFLAPKQLNHLIGSIKNYIQFTDDIAKRAGKAKSVNVSNYEHLIKILEMVLKYSGQISNLITDYFSDEEEYAHFVKLYVDFDDDAMPSDSIALKMFCTEKINGKEIGTYHNGTNAILNRNLIMAKLFGNVSFLPKALNLQRVNRSTFTSMRNYEKKLESVFKKGCCETKEEQEKLKKYQEMINRIEQTDVLKYTEIISDLYTQLISWAYMRERDLMYYQFGYKYIKLFFGNADENSVLNQIDTKVNCGAVLYQIAAVHDRNLPLYNSDGAVSVKAGEGMLSKRVSTFDTQYVNGLWDEGTELFQKEENVVLKLRNYIDHFKYFTGEDKSMLELYADVFQYFFTYDRKLQKSVTFVLSNVLERHFITSTLSMREARETADNKKIAGITVTSLISNDITYSYLEKTATEKAAPKKASTGRGGSSGFAALQSLLSENNTEKKDSKNVKNQTIQLNAVTHQFMKNVYRLLNYPHDVNEEILTKVVDGNKK